MTRIEYAVPSDSLLLPCRPYRIDVATNGELLTALIDLHAEYRICAARMDAMIEYFGHIAALNADGDVP